MNDTTQPPLLDPDRLTVNQLRGLNCAYCKERLFRARSLGTRRIGTGVHADDVELYACTPACGETSARRPQAWCHFCHDPIDAVAAVPIAYRPALSGPGQLIYADVKCRVAYRVLPLAEHPSDTDGGIRFRERTAHAPTVHGGR